MRRLLLTSSAVLVFACTPDIPNVPPPSVVTAQFDPSAVPAVVPTPNDLAFDPATGQLKIAPAATATDADKEFLGYLNTLNGFPAGSSANATFDGTLDPASVTTQSVRVLDLGGGFAQVSTAVVSYTDLTGNPSAAGRVTVRPPPGGWTPGKSYGIALVGGDAGLKGSNAQPVVGSATWAFIRSKGSLVTCEDLTSPDCRTTTEVIPSSINDPAARLKDQTAKALQLEQLRRKYLPALDALETAGVPRANVALFWTFKVVDLTQLAFNPAASPPQVPLPNDLALDPTTGLVNAPVDPTAPAAQQEFTRDYLNTLDGFPVSASASATVLNGDLDPATVTPSTVRVVDLTALGADAGTPVAATVSYNATAHQVVVSPPATGWPKGKRFAIAVVGGANGVKRTGGGKVVGSDVWALARSKSSLVTCANLSAVDCAPALSVAPLSAAEAVRLEGLRRGLSPVLDALEAKGLKRADVAVLWVFSVVNRAEVTFDPAKQIIPFPNDLLMNQQTGKVNLPIPPGAPQPLADLLGGLNTLDGFSTTAPVVSENSDALGATDVSPIDSATLLGNALAVKVATGTPAPMKPCLNCASSLLADGGTPASPTQLQFVPQVPLEEKTLYAVIVTTGVKDARGKPVVPSPTFALLRSSAALVDAGGKSQVSGVADAQAAALEPLRLAFKSLFDGLTLAGFPRTKVALAWTFRTQSTVSVLKALHAAPGALPITPLYLSDATASLKPTIQEDATAIDKIYEGALYAPFALNGPGGTLNPASTAIQRAPFLVTLPTGTVPGTGWPVAIFGHGLGSNRTAVLHLAGALAAKGLATIAIDAVLHGERSVCTGSKAALGQASDDAACADPVTQTCDAASGRCVARDPLTRLDCSAGAGGQAVCTAAGQGLCLEDAKCEGGDYKRAAAGGPPIISSWNYLNLTNLFATRDNFRHPVADLAQVVRVLKGTGAGSLNERLNASAGVTLDPAKIHYVGQSLGAMHGALFTAASPDVHRVVLNVGASDQVTVLLTAPGFATQRAGFLGSLAGLGLTPGSPGFDQFIVLARTIMDPADPQNAIAAAVNATLPADRKVFLQYIEPDLTLPNPTTLSLIAAGNQNAAKQMAVYKVVPGAGEFSSPGQHHGYLLRFPQGPSTVTGQSQVATFFETGVTP